MTAPPYLTPTRYRWMGGRAKRRCCHECGGSGVSSGPREKWNPFNEHRQLLLDLDDQVHYCGSCWGRGHTYDDSVELAELDEIITARKEAANAKRTGESRRRHASGKDECG